MRNRLLLVGGLFLFGMFVVGVLRTTMLAASNPQDPGSIPTPTGVDPIPEEWFVRNAELATAAGEPSPTTLPSPVPGFRMGQIRSFTSTGDTPLPYEIVEIDRHESSTGLTQLSLTDTTHGETLQLGDDLGHALLEAVTERYILWHYLACRLCEESSSRLSGLYAYDIVQQREIAITPGIAGRTYPEVSGVWVVYSIPSAEQQFVMTLHAHNLETSETILLDEQVARSKGAGTLLPDDVYAIGGDVVAWIPTPFGDDRLHIYDLNERKLHPVDPGLDITPFTAFLNVWETVLTLNPGEEPHIAYDYEHDALFAIDVLPDGWERVPHSLVDNKVEVREDQLYWTLRVDGQKYHFTAPIVRNEP